MDKEGSLPAGLTADSEAHDAWFRAKVLEALVSKEPTVPHQQVMDEAQALIDMRVLHAAQQWPPRPDKE
jgi:DNA-damage-inducible protein J